MSWHFPNKLLADDNDAAYPAACCYASVQFILLNLLCTARRLWSRVSQQSAAAADPSSDISRCQWCGACAGESTHQLCRESEADVAAHTSSYGVAILVQQGLQPAASVTTGQCTAYSCQQPCFVSQRPFTLSIALCMMPFSQQAVCVLTPFFHTLCSCNSTCAAPEVLPS